MQTFSQEIQDGLGELITANNKIVLAGAIHSSNLSQDEAKIALASANLEFDDDLFPLDAVLVSTGWNKNTDVFDKAETYKARATPVHKQLNFMHDDNIIIGHMIDCQVIAQNGQAIAEDDLSDFDIVFRSVIYKHFRDSDKQDIVNSVLANLDKWFVSMECFFDGFDYALIDIKSQEQKIVPRTETSAWLSKHLLAYGGSGEYNGHKVGRLLRNITFSGVGVVDNPANPRSVILTKIEPTSIEANLESENMDELNEVKAKLETEVSKVQTLASENQNLKSLAEETKNVLAETQEKLEAKVAEVEALKAELQKLVAEKKKADRKGKLMTMCKVDDARAEELVTKFANADDELFEEVVKLATVQAASDKKEEKEEETEDDSNVAEVITDNIEAAKPEETTASVTEPEIVKDDGVKSAVASFVSNLSKTKRGKK